MPPRKDVTGQKFGRLTAIKRDGKRGKESVWLCQCSCGNTFKTRLSYLTCGRTQSCGCFALETCIKNGEANKTHGHSPRNTEKSSTYRVWQNMKQRCLNSKHTSYKYYGERGITICDRWLTFENFLEDMGEKPKGTSIDRIDNDAGYEPSNCRWATPKQQANNRRCAGKRRR